MGETVVLNWSQMKFGAEVGLMRSLSAVFSGRKGKYGCATSPGWEGNISSSQAEMAVAKFFNLYWDGSIGDFSAKDVGGIIQVRSSTDVNHDLRLHPNDCDSDPFVSVLVQGNMFTLHGWAFAKDGKRKEFWRDGQKGRPAFWMPRSLLRPLSELSECVREKRV